MTNWKLAVTPSKTKEILSARIPSALASNVESIAGAADALFFTAARHPRASDPAALRALAGRGVAFASSKRALDAARQFAGKRGLVVVAGSFYLAGDLLPGIRRR